MNTESAEQAVLVSPSIEYHKIQKTIECLEAERAPEKYILPLRQQLERLR